jgi:hypothetical protein
MAPLRPVRSLKQHRSLMRAEDDCWRAEIFPKSVEPGGSSALKKAGTRLSLSDYRGHPKGTAMKSTTIALKAAQQAEQAGQDVKDRTRLLPGVLAKQIVWIG